MPGLYSNSYFDRSFVLTSATQGPGPDLARALVARGAKPIAIDRNQCALDRLSDDLGGGIVTLARDLGEPTAPVEIARWLADEHRNIGGLISNCAAPRTDDMNRRLIAPLAILGFLGAFLPERRDLSVGVVFDTSDPGRDIVRFSQMVCGIVRDRGHHSCLTTALLTGSAAAEDPGARRRAADLVLDALAAGRTMVRVRSRTGLLRVPRGARNAGKHAEEPA